MFLSQKISINQREWILWILIILTGTIAGIAFSRLFTIILGVGVGGVTAGIFPWFLNKSSISSSALWLFIGTLIASILISSAILITSNPSISIIVMIFEGILTSSFVAGITRQIHQRWSEHRNHWWLWVLGSLLILIVLGVSFLLFLITAVSSINV